MLEHAELGTLLIGGAMIVATLFFAIVIVILGMARQLWKLSYRVGVIEERETDEEFGDDLARIFRSDRACEHCGCTEERACRMPDGLACWWVDETLCSNPECVASRGPDWRPPHERAGPDYQMLYLRSNTIPSWPSWPSNPLRDGWRATPPPVDADLSNWWSTKLEHGANGPRWSIPVRMAK